MRSPAGCPELWLRVNTVALKLRPLEQAAHSPSRGPRAGRPVSKAQNSGSQESRPRGSAMCRSSQPGGKQLSCLEKASLAVSAFSEKMRFHFKCEEGSLYERRRLEPRDASVCAFRSKTLEKPLDLQLSSHDKYRRFRTGELARLPTTATLHSRFHPSLS